LFGHEKGSFTGATEKHQGKFVEADGGTLFLDEIGDLPLDAQVKLLRAVQEGEIDPVGGRKTVKVDIRLISATHRNLIEHVRAGKFREDLYYRINVFPIFVPSLRDRREDIPWLVRHFVARFAAEEGRKGLSNVSSPAMAMLKSYDWPGNVRQLENAVFRSVVMCEGKELTPDDFPQIQSQTSRYEVMMSATEDEQDVIIAEEAQNTPVLMDENALPLLAEDGEMRSLMDIEEQIIRRAIAFYDGQMSEVARRLGIGRSTLYRKLKEYGIESDDAEAVHAA
jgi:DNA-binding NtrC family response regulator